MRLRLLLVGTLSLWATLLLISLGETLSATKSQVPNKEPQLPTGVILELSSESRLTTAFMMEELEVTESQYIRIRLIPGHGQAWKRNEWELRIENWQIETTKPETGEKLRLALPKTNEPVGNKCDEFLKRIIDARIRLQLQPDGGVKLIARPKELGEQHIPVPPEAEPFVLTLISEEYLSALASVACYRFPKGLRAGDRWTKTTAAEAATLGRTNLGSFQCGSHYYVEATTDKVVHLRITPSIKHLIPKGRERTTGDASLLKVIIAKKDSKGKAVVERATGRVIRSDVSLNIEGSWELGSPTDKVRGKFKTFTRLRVKAQD